MVARELIGRFRRASPRRLAEAARSVGRPSGRSREPLVHAETPEGWVAHLYRLRWPENGVLELQGWVYVRTGPLAEHPGRLRVWLEVADGDVVIEADVVQGADEAIEVVSTDRLHARQPAAFTARIDLGDRALGPIARRRRLSFLTWLELEGTGASEGEVGTGTFTGRAVDGSPAALLSTTLAGGASAKPEWGADDGLRIRVDPRGPTAAGPQRRPAQVSEVELTGDDAAPVLVVRGTWRNGPSGTVDVVLRGRPESVRTGAATVDDGEFTARIPMLGADRWGNDGLAPLLGRYHVDAVAPGGRRGEPKALGLAADLESRLPLISRHPRLNLRVARNDDGDLLLGVTGPLPAADTGPWARNRNGMRLAAAAPKLRDAGLFESFVGKGANDNTRALHDEIVRRRPDLTRYWVVGVRSFPLPDGVIPVVYRSAQWWDLVGECRLIVTNSWLPTGYERRPYQTVLQTWHGTPFKRMGMDRLGREGDQEYAARTRREVAAWTYLLSQNPHSTATFRAAYGYTGEVLEEGYPRNDSLALADASRRSAVRSRLGIGADDLVVLYAPTFRDGTRRMVDALDTNRLADALGPQSTVLVRGHFNATRRNRMPLGGPVLDVTTYPDIVDLFHAADVCITDYSSLMFDWTVTGRPLLFFVPDLAEYGDSMRGVYFDLASTSPGPLLTTTDQIVEAVRDLDAVSGEYADRYRTWQQRYVPWDDGHVAERVVDRLLADLDRS